MSSHTRTADSITNAELSAYLLEQLPIADQSAIEQALRDDESLRRRASVLANRRDPLDHSVGSIWRSRRISCPSRSELGAFLLGTLADGHSDYISFHLRAVGCRYCLANLADLQSTAAEPADSQKRRERYFTSSAGHLKNRAE